MNETPHTYGPVLSELPSAAGEGRPLVDRRRPDPLQKALAENAERDALLLRLSDALRELADPADVQGAAARLLGEHLGVQRAVYAEVNGDVTCVRGEYVDGVLPLPQRFPSAVFGEQVLAACRGGESVAVEDVEADARFDEEQRAWFRAAQVAAFAGVMLLRQGQWVAAFGVHSATPRRWASGELRLVRDVAERTWDAAQRARAEAALREGEARQAFVLAVADALRSATDANEIKHTACRMLGEHLGADRVHYAEMHEDEDLITVGADYCSHGLASLEGTYRFSDFRDTSGLLRGGATIAIDDTETSPMLSEEARAMYRVMGVRSWVATPRVHDSGLAWALSVLNVAPHEWLPEEISLVTEVGRRTWDAVQRATAEAALRESERQQRALAASLELERHRLEAVLRSLPVGVWISDRQGRLVGKNEEADRIWRGDAPLLEHQEDYVQYAAWDSESGRELRPEDYPVSRALESGAATGPVELRIRRFDGSEGTVLVSAVPFRDGEGRVLGSVAINLDITERAAMEAALREGEARQAFLVRLNDALGPLAEPAEIQHQAARLLGEHLHASRVGYAEDAGDGETIVVTRNHTHGVRGIEGRYRYEDYGPELLREFRQGRTVVRPDVGNDPWLTPAEKAAHVTLQIGSSVNVPLVKSGRLRAVLFAHFRDPHPWSPEELTLIEDVANRTWDAVERARAEAALRDSEQRFRLMADLAPIAVWVTDATGNVEFVNGEYCRYFGRTLEEVRGPNWRVLIHEEDGAYVEAFAEATRERRPFSAEGRVRRADGAWRWVASYGTPRVSAAGEFLGMVGITHDVSEVKRVEEQHVEAARQKDAFIAVLAHELRNPLAPLRMAVGLLQARGGDDPVVGQCRDVIERQVAQMARLLDDLLDVSRLSQGKLALRRTDVLLRDALDAAVETVRPLFSRAGHTLVVETPAEAIRVEGDAARLIQVFGNLLNNAAKYTDPGGEVRVAVQAAEGSVTVRVSDTGMGIEPDMVQRVFDLFTQGGGPGEHSSGGLGIGLALARQLVELHGGTIHCESAGRGMGSTFVVSLPRTIDPAPQARPAGKGEAVRLDRRVLVVDDNEDAADMTAALLQHQGCEVRAVYGGEAALREAETFGPDVILLDLGMPGVDGAETCRRIRRQPWGAAIAIVAVTGWGQEEDRRRSAQAGFDGHLVKPVDPSALTTLLQRLRRD